MVEVADFRIEDHVNNCRLCFKPFTDDHKPIVITEAVEKKFFELTQFQLMQDEAFSSVICILCENDLDVFINYRSSILARQKKLCEIRFKEQHSVNFRTARVKKEFEPGNVFIDCSTFVSNHDRKSKEALTAKQIKLTDDKKDNRGANENWKASPSKTAWCSKLIDLKSSHSSIRTTVHQKKQCKVHLNMKSVYCDSCSYGAFFKYDLEQHMKTHIKKLKEPEKYFCEICGLEFEKRFHLNAHVKAKHTVKERIHQCTVCQKTFYTAENLKKHAESHEKKDKPCEFCGKLFTCMNNLRTHLYYHAEPKFLCEFPNCDKKFFMKKRLRAHLKSHRGQKDFVCKTCEKSYFSQNDLNRHLFSIHEKLRFFCQVENCSGNFSRREYYKKHALAHHSNLSTLELDRLLEDIKAALPSRAH